MHLPSFMVRSRHMLTAVFGPFHRSPQTHGCQWNKNLLRVEQHNLDAKTPTDIRVGHADLISRKTKEHSKPIANRDGGLCAIPDRQCAFESVKTGNHAACFQRLGSTAVDTKLALEDMACLSKGSINVTNLLYEVCSNILGSIGMHKWRIGHHCFLQ